MVEITVGVASAFIAAGIAILQFILPNALALILTGRLSEESSYSAVTWSVVSRFILSSHWPLILRSDATASKSVARSVSWIVWVRPIGFLLIAVAAVVTPLGLFETFTMSSGTIDVQFMYAPGDDAFSRATTPRSANLGPSRLCSDWRLCPGMPYLGNTTLISSGSDQNVPIKTPALPSSVINLYQSGRDSFGPSMSGPFDIEFRQFGVRSRSDMADNASYVVPRFGRLTTVLQHRRLDLVEGLIVDSISGGIGFRNHSVPVGVQYAAEWEEEILFMEPEASCVNLNVTIAYEIPKDRVGDTYKLLYQTWYLVDRGGFVNLAKDAPYPLMNESYPFTHGQDDPQLYERAYSAAWTTNYYAMLTRNLTTRDSSVPQAVSSIGQKLKMRHDQLSLFDVPDGAIFKNNYYVYRSLAGDELPDYWAFDNLTELSRSPFGTGVADMDNIATDLAVVALAATESVELPKDVGTGNTTYERAVYICSTATRMSVRTVRFSYNTTGDTNILARCGVVDGKQASDSKSGKQLTWAQETPSPPVALVDGSNNWLLDPLWGLFDQTAMSTPNTSTRVSDSFYIPNSYSASWAPTMGLNFEYNNIPATVGAPAIWGEALNDLSSTQAMYSGEGDQVLSDFWRERSHNASGVALILKLIWTDIAASVLVGTKGLHTTDSMSPDIAQEQVGSDEGLPQRYPIHIYARQIRYRWVYGVPAMLCLLVVGSAVVLALVPLLFRQGSIQKLRRYMFQVTAGRILTSWTFPETRPVTLAQTDQWIDRAGSRQIDIFAHSTDIDLNRTEASSKNRYVKVRQREESSGPPPSASHLWTQE